MKTIELSQGKVAIVDDADYGRVSQFKWTASNSGCKWYAIRRPRVSPGKYQMVYMHRFIMEVDGRIPEIDHKDGDGLNNTRANIRACTSTQNKQNRVKRKRPSTSRYKGVSWCSTHRYWVVQIVVDGKHKFLGTFHDEVKAGERYAAAAKLYFGEFARSA